MRSIGTLRKVVVLAILTALLLATTGLIGVASGGPEDAPDPTPKTPTPTLPPDDTSGGSTDETLVVLGLLVDIGHVILL